MTEKICSFENCNSPIRCKGVCNKHYHTIKQLEKRKPCACGCGEMTSYTYKHGHHTRMFSSEEQSRRGQMNDGSAPEELDRIGPIANLDNVMNTELLQKENRQSLSKG